MRTPYPAVAVLSAVLLSLAACSSGGGDDKAAGTPTSASAPAATPAPGTSASTAKPSNSSAPSYRVYRDSPGGSTDIGLADLLLTGTTATNEANARAAIEDFVHVQDAKGSAVAYVIHVVPSKAPDGRFICMGNWRKDAAATAAFGGKQGLTINCPTSTS